MNIRLVVTFIPLLCLLATPASAVEVIEAWRSPFGLPRCAAVNPTDGSCWVASGASIMHLAADGALLSQTDGFWRPWSVSVDPSDGSAWIADISGYDITHLAEDGTELWRQGGFPRASSVSVNPVDGSCWVAARGIDAIVHLAADGTELGRAGSFSEARSVSVCPADGSCWVADNGGDVAHLDAEGTELWRGSVGRGLSVVADPEDGSCWVGRADNGSGNVKRLAGDGTLLWTSSVIYAAHLSLDASDGSCWVVDHWHDELVHFAKDGTELERRQGLPAPYSVAADPSDGSIWVGLDGLLWNDSHSSWDYGESALLHLSADGSELWQGQEFSYPEAVSVNTTDGSCWVADTGNGEAVHLARDGTVLWRSAAFGPPEAVSANSTDGSCWIASPESGVVVRIGADHTELATVSGLAAPVAVSTDRVDGSCWVADGDSGEVIHLAASGAEMWRGTLSGPWSVSVDASDRSCWVGDPVSDEVVHLAQDGTELTRFPFINPARVAASPSHGTVWVLSSGGRVYRFAADGTELSSTRFYEAQGIAVDEIDGYCWVVTRGYDVLALVNDEGTEVWRGGGLYIPEAVAVDSSDGSCWVADMRNCQIAHFARVSPFEDIPANSWAADAIEACADGGIVAGYEDGLYHPEWPVARDQMAAYISRSICTPTGEAGLADYIPPATPSFTDVAADYWAYKYIEYAVAANVVGGYEDGAYHPEYVLDRAQMAVFIARALVTPSGDAGVPDPVGDPTFPDVTPESNYAWCCKHVEYIAAEGVCGGYEDDCYHPEYVCTRDQMAVYISRAFHLP